MRQVERNDHDVRAAWHGFIEVIAACFLAVKEDRAIGIGGNVTILHVNLAIEGLQYQCFHILAHVVDDVIDIRQLIAFGIDHVEIWVAGEIHLCGIGPNESTTIQGLTVGSSAFNQSVLGFPAGLPPF